MIIELGNYSYEYGNINEWERVTSQFRDMAKRISAIGAIEHLDYIIENYGEQVVYWLYPFTGSLELFEKCLLAIDYEVLTNFKSNDLESLKSEAVALFNDSKWYRIDEITTLYTFTLNGSKHFAEIMEP